jgi:hypothetical protein
MLLIEEAKAPPPMPESKAAADSVNRLGSSRLSSHAASAQGRISSIVVSEITVRPPIGKIRNEFEMRKVPPDSPANAGSMYKRLWYRRSSLLEKPKANLVGSMSCTL